MKQTLLFLLFLLRINAIAQIVITPGAQLSLSNNAQFTLENINLVNNGSFLAGNSNVFFTGNASSNISGSQSIQFYSIEINKTSGSAVLLQRGITVAQTLTFTTGFLDLNGFDTDLGATGILNNEQENSRVISTNGGRVISTVNLNAPTAVNPGNLGAIITSAQNMGSTIIRRGHVSQVNGNNTGNSIKRYYEIIPTNNSGLNATLRINYFDGELNGLTENTLTFWKSPGTTGWVNIGFNTRSTTTNFVEKTAIADFSRLTLSSVGNVLPVHFVLFNVHCQNNVVKLVWKTAQEQNVREFQVQKSEDGVRFTTIGTVTAAGNSPTEKTYTYSDNTTSSRAVLYRIAEVDNNGSMQFTSINSVQCGNVVDDVKLWPNPVGQTLYVNVTTAQASPVMIKLFDVKGALVKTISNELLSGSNQLSIDMSRLAVGMYNVAVSWNKSYKVVKVVKQ